jgi:hypothetical protein
MAASQKTDSIVTKRLPLFLAYFHLTFVLARLPFARAIAKESVEQAQQKVVSVVEMELVLESVAQ